MMGHRDKLKSGDEWDGLSRRSKGLFNWRSGARKLLKRAVNKRSRRRDIEIDDHSGSGRGDDGFNR